MNLKAFFTIATAAVASLTTQNSQTLFVPGADGNTPGIGVSTNGNVGVGTSSPGANLHIGKQDAPANTAGESVRLVLQPYGHTGGPWKFICRDIPGSAYMDLYYGSTLLFIVHHNGSLLIGKTSQTNTAYKLDVAGKIRADEIVVNTTGADFVFAPSYILRPLSEVENFIKQNQHLPDIAPAAQMKQEGVDVSEMQTKLLQRVEELTLYIIGQEKAKAELKTNV